MNARGITVALALAVTPHALAAQETPSASAAATVEATAQAGLPSEPVRRVVAEGGARGADEGQIARAAVAARNRLRISREALGDGKHAEPTSAEIVAGAEALLGGARPADLRRVRDAAPADRSMTASLNALAKLSSRGEDPARTSAAIAAKLAAGASDGAIAGMAELGRAGDASMSAVSGSVSGRIDNSVRVGIPNAGATVGGSVVGGLGVGGL